jgi:hypothetical protein
MEQTTRVGRKVKPYLQKALESALLAVEVYNKPGTSFKSAAFIVLMVIAWTSLFHAIFIKKGEKPYRRTKSGRFEKVDGDHKHWEIAECIGNYWASDTSNPIRKNLEFFIPLRNKIEHRQLPELDSAIFGECQALLLNFDNLIGKHFGSRHQIREFLSFSLQLFPSKESLVNAVRGNKVSKEIKHFIEQYRSSLAPGVYSNDQYAFKAYLIQVANHESRDALPIKFIRFNDLSADQHDALEQFIVAVKTNRTEVSSKDLLLPSAVVSIVQSRIKKRFTMTQHIRFWKRYQVRPETNSKSPEKTQSRYCVYVHLSKSYGYTNEWIELIVKELTNT